MWECKSCGESVEDNFEVCWKCGSVRDDISDSQVQSKSDDRPIPDPGDESTPASSNSGSQSVTTDATGGLMDRREIAELICKSLAVLIFAQGAYYSVTVVFAIMAVPIVGWWEFFVYLAISIPMFAAGLVGIICWKHADGIASHMVSSNPTPVTKGFFTVADAMMVAFSTSGIFILFQGLREIVAATFLAQLSYYPLTEFFYDSRAWTGLVGIGLGLWLLLGSRGILGSIKRLRSLGVPELK